MCSCHWVQLYENSVQRRKIVRTFIPHSFILPCSIHWLHEKRSDRAENEWDCTLPPDSSSGSDGRTYTSRTGVLAAAGVVWWEEGVQVKGICTLRLKSLNLENLHPACSISYNRENCPLVCVCVSPGSLNWSQRILTDILADPNPAAYTVTMLWWEDHFLVSVLGDPTPRSKALTSQKSGDRRNPSKSQQGWRTSSGSQALKSSALQFIKWLLGRVHQQKQSGSSPETGGGAVSTLLHLALNGNSRATLLVSFSHICHFPKKIRNGLWLGVSLHHFAVFTGTTQAAYHQETGAELVWKRSC